jgi:hypothetical protein
MTKEKTFDRSSPEDTVFTMQIKFRVVGEKRRFIRTGFYYFVTAKFIEMCITTFGRNIQISVPAGHFEGNSSNSETKFITDIEILGLDKQDEVLRLFR